MLISFVLQENDILLKKYFEAKRLRPHKTCALMLDLRGRTVRIGKFLNTDYIDVKQGETVEVRTDGIEIACTKEELQINYYDLPPVMREGDEVILGHNG